VIKHGLLWLPNNVTVFHTLEKIGNGLSFILRKCTMYGSRTLRFHSLYNLGICKVHVVPRLHIMLCVYMYTQHKCITHSGLYYRQCSR